MTGGVARFMAQVFCVAFEFLVARLPRKHEQSARYRSHVGSGFALHDLAHSAE